VPQQVDQHACVQVDPFDLDGVEIWGPVDDPGGPDYDIPNDDVFGGMDGPAFDDSNRYSLVGDPVGPGGTRVSVWSYNKATNTSVPYVSTQMLIDEMERLLGEDLPTNEEEDFDVDALMIWDEVNPGQLDPGADAVLFSLRPILGRIDGGEIIFWDYQNPAQYLNHGGHVWDLAHDVRIDPHDLQTLGNWNNDANVDAIEALPEPATLGLLALGGLALLRRRRS
jgi:hypothetical protein